MAFSLSCIDRHIYRIYTNYTFDALYPKAGISDLGVALSTIFIPDVIGFVADEAEGIAAIEF